MKKIPQKKIEAWKDLMRELPVSVNNYYGDPVIQWLDTVGKLQKLLDTKHRGPIGIITKGRLTENHVRDLKSFAVRGLKIVVLLSISELAQFEKVGMEHRYRNIALLNKYGISNIAYVRPMTPPYNTSKEVIDLIFKKLREVGAKYVVASGFRGDDKLIAEMSPEESVAWALRVKIMTKEVYDLIRINAEKYGIKFFTRTSCGVSAALRDETTYNPYYYSPNLVHCEELGCPIRDTCKPITKARPGSINFLRYLGYDLETKSGDCNLRCPTKADKRLSCPSCCTTCYMLKVPRVEVKGKVGLGDLTFVRFVTGVLAVQPGVNDNGDKEIGRVNLRNFPELKNIQCLNTWLPYAHIGDRCFDCKYCIEKYYGSNRKNVGLAPAELIDKVIK